MARELWRMLLVGSGVPVEIEEREFDRRFASAGTARVHLEIDRRPLADGKLRQPDGAAD